MQINDNEIKVIWAALVAMVDDIHAPQDNLSEKEWDIAEELLSQLNSIMDDNANP